jgi:hypothetical protein
MESNRSNSFDENLKALMQYRRARGLCEKCAEKWTYGHKSAPIVQLHVIQELWDLFPKEEVHDVLGASLCLRPKVTSSAPRKLAPWTHNIFVCAGSVRRWPKSPEACRRGLR